MHVPFSLSHWEKSHLTLIGSVLNFKFHITHNYNSKLYKQLTTCTSSHKLRKNRVTNVVIVVGSTVPYYGRLPETACSVRWGPDATTCTLVTRPRDAYDIVKKYNRPRFSSGTSILSNMECNLEGQNERNTNQHFTNMLPSCAGNFT